MTMPKVFVRGEDQPIAVSKEDAERILGQKNDQAFKGMIEVAGRNLSKQQVYRVDTREGVGVDRYNLDLPEHREMVKLFEIDFFEASKDMPPGPWAFERYCAKLGAVRIGWSQGNPEFVVTNAALYNELKAKYDGLRQLMDRREFAKRSEMTPEEIESDNKRRAEASARVKDALRSLKKKVEMPKVSDPIAEALDLEEPPPYSEGDLPPIT